MELHELALQYRESGLACSKRVAELRRLLPLTPRTGTEIIVLRRRIIMLEGMARDALATAAYLENYYRRSGNEGDGGKKKKGPCPDERYRILQSPEFRKAIREAGKRGGKDGRRSA